MSVDGEEPVDDHVEDDEEETEFPFLKAQHPLLDRVQKALYDQISAANERVTLKLRERKEDLKQLVKHREDIGVTLYGSQQQLAKLQITLEKLLEQYTTTVNERTQAEDSLVDVQKTFEERKRDVEKHLKRLHKAQDESNQLNITLRQVDEYNKQMNAEIQITRRATYKAEDNIKNIEKVKTKQDLLIDKMNGEVKRLLDRKALFEAQLLAQRQETAAATSTLQEAAKEMESIEFEKRQLVMQWKSSLIGMQRRDEALQNVQKALYNQSEQELALDAEVRGVESSIRQQQEEHENLTGLLQKNEAEMSHLNTQMQQIKSDRARLTEQYTILKKSLDTTHAETAKVETCTKEKQSDLELVEKNVQKIARETTAVVDQIEGARGEQTTVTRAEANTLKAASKIGKHIAEKEMELGHLENEIARVKVDALNTKAHNLMLQDRLKTCASDLSEREKVIDQYELEIRKRHHQIEKKQLYVDRLNREYDDKRTKAGDEESTGPLEGKIKALRKGIDDKKKEMADMQKDWITKQTELLSIEAKTEENRSRLQEQRNQKLVMDQKKVRMEGNLESLNKEIKELNNGVRTLRFDIEKLNKSTAMSDVKSSELKSKNENMETEFVAKLQEAETHCKTLEENAAKAQEEKTAMLEEIVEAERQGMLWERKIQLEKEMQEALDPSVGQSEVSAMKKEIHRMELRYDQLKRRQEQMIMEMERVIHKRDTISLKYEPKPQKGKGPAKNNPKRQIAAIKNNLKMCTQASADLDQRLGQFEEDGRDLQGRIESTQQETGDMERMVGEHTQSVERNTVIKVSNLQRIVRLQQLGRRMDEIVSGTAPRVTSRSVEQRIETEETNRQKILSVVRELQEAYPQLELLRHVEAWTESYRCDVEATNEAPDGP